MSHLKILTSNNLGPKPIFRHPLDFTVAITLKVYLKSVLIWIPIDNLIKVELNHTYIYLIILIHVTFIDITYMFFVSEKMAVTMETEVKEEFVPMNVKVELTEGDTPIELNLDAQADGSIKGEARVQQKTWRNLLFKNV